MDEIKVKMISFLNFKKFEKYDNFTQNEHSTSNKEMGSAARRLHLQTSVQSTKRETARLGMRGGVVGQVYLHWKHL